MWENPKFLGKKLEKVTMKLKNGQTVAACVIYADSDEYSWIIARIEKKQVNGNYIVHDDCCDQPEFERYIVPPSKLIPFPSQNERYEPGEYVLALWHDAGSDKWSTMLYEAVVVEVLSQHHLVINYKGSQRSPNVEIDDSKISKFPQNFDLGSAGKLEGKEEEEKEKKVERKEENAIVNEENIQTGELTAKQKIIEAQEEARINFLIDKPAAPREKPDFKPLTDEDFNALVGERPKDRRKIIEKGTPLLDFLEDDVLFPKSAPHITGNGVLKRKGIEPPPPQQSGLMNGTVKCGRLSKILNEWRNIY